MFDQDSLINFWIQRQRYTALPTSRYCASCYSALYYREHERILRSPIIETNIHGAIEGDAMLTQFFCTDCATMCDTIVRAIMAGREIQSYCKDCEVVCGDVYVDEHKEHETTNVESFDRIIPPVMDIE